MANLTFHNSLRNKVPQPTYTVTLKLRELHLQGQEHNHSATLRVGWMSSQMSVFTHWKNVQNGRVGWKSSLVQTVSPDAGNISLVIYQKVGDYEMPIGLRRIPCAKILCTEQKHLFKIPVEEMVKGGAELIGSIRSKLDRIDTYTEDNNNLCNVNGHQVMNENSHDGSTVSSRSSGEGRSIDMSIDLTMEVPTNYFPLITAQEVYRCIIVKHFETTSNRDLFKRVIASLLRIPDGLHEFTVSNVCDQSEINQIDMNLYKELEIELNAAFANDGRFSSFYWNVRRTTDFKALKVVITECLQKCEAGAVPRETHMY